MTQTLAIARTDVPGDVAQMMQVARFLAPSGMIPDHLKGEPANLFSVMLTARALDIPMATAFQHIIVIADGKVGMSAILMQALVIRSGYALYPIAAGPDFATVRAERPGIGPNREGWVHISFGLDEAERAGLLAITDGGKVRARAKESGKVKPWEAWTADMMTWRAIGRAARQYFPDVLMGMVYTPDEIGAEVDAEGAPVRVSSVRVDVSEDVRRWTLRIQAVRDLEALREVYAELTDTDMLNAVTGDGYTLAQCCAKQKTAIMTANRKARKTATRDESPRVAEQDTAEQDDTEVDAAPEIPPDPDAEPDPDTEPTPRRRGVLNAAAETFGGPDAAERAIVEQFGRPLDSVGTTDIQHWVLAQRKAN